MNIVIIGPGALGTLLATSLAPTAKSSKTELWMLDHNPERAALLAEQGLVLEKESRLLSFPVRASADPKTIGPADIIFLCVKSSDVADGLDQAAKLSHAESILVTLQNGIGHLELIKAYKGPPAIALGVTALGANIVAPGHVRYAGGGLTRIGFLKSANFARSLLLARVCNLLSSSGMETVIVDNILDYIWSKLLVNVGINALSAIYRCPNGQLLESSETQAMLTAAVREGESVAGAMGINLPEDPLAMTLEVCKKTAANLSSMLQDVNSKRPTEIDSINGAIVAAGRKLAIPVPVNEELVIRVKEIERSY
jgi:2-dehydropantoate 2-reductase